MKDWYDTLYIRWLVGYIRCVIGRLVCLLSFRFVLAVSFFLGVESRLHAQQRRLSIMEYNVENLFDTLHAENLSDEEFTPRGSYQWTSRRYWSKLSRLSRVIAGAGGLQPVDLVALVEVENDSVMSHLTQRTKLWRMGYEYLITHSPDRRGVNVALLYQPHRFRPFAKDSLRVLPLYLSQRPTRDVLHVAGELFTGDTLDVFVCHLPSRRGGKQAQVYRELWGDRLRGYVDSVMRLRRFPKVIVTGDFNAFYPESIFTNNLSVRLPAERGGEVEEMEEAKEAKEVGEVGEVEEAEKAEKTERDATPISQQMDGVAMSHTPRFSERCYSSTSLYLLSYRLHARNGIAGTYKFQGEWNQLDHFIVNGGLLQSDGDSRLHTSSSDCRIVDFPFLLETERSGEGVRPKRTYLGTYYHGGYSDHLPLLLYLNY